MIKVWQKNCSCARVVGLINDILRMVMGDCEPLLGNSQLQRVMFSASDIDGNKKKQIDITDSTELPELN